MFKSVLALATFVAVVKGNAARGDGVQLSCADMPDLQFETFWSDVKGRLHVDLNDDNVIEFKVKGGQGVNILLVNKETLPDEVTESYADAYEMFIGGEQEPVVYSAGCAGCAPDDNEIVDISANPLVVSDAYTSVWIQVEGTVVKVGEGNYSAEKTGLIYEADMDGAEKGIDRAVFTYGYGDLECIEDEPPKN